jgi:hypothetical protein
MVATNHLGVERLSSGAQCVHIRRGDMNINLTIRMFNYSYYRG